MNDGNTRFNSLNPFWVDCYTWKVNQIILLYRQFYCYSFEV